MKHILKNKSQDKELIFGELIIPSLGEYVLYDDVLNFYGTYFKSFKDNFSTEFQDYFEYSIDGAIKPLDDFYQFLIKGFNDPIVETYDDNRNYRIYSILNSDKRNYFINPTILPSSINYKIDVTRLHQKLTFKKGILVECEYFENLDVTYNQFGLEVYNYSNPVLKVNSVYYVSNNSYVDYRVTKRYWTYDNYTYSSDYKETIKYYDTKAARDEGNIRRDNIINDCVTTIGGLLIMTEPSITTIKDAETFALPILDYLDSDINKFIKGNIEPMVTTVSTLDVGTLGNLGNWFENLVPNTQITIRQLLLSKLSEGFLVPNEIITV